jgi:hypothetical protein
MTAFHESFSLQEGRSPGCRERFFLAPRLSWAWPPSFFFAGSLIGGVRQSFFFARSRAGGVRQSFFFPGSLARAYTTRASARRKIS